MASTQVNLYEAKTQLSNLVERVATGEEFVIAKGGQAKARLVALAEEPKQPRVSGQNLLGITYIATTLMLRLPEDVLQGFWAIENETAARHARLSVVGLDDPNWPESFTRGIALPQMRSFACRDGLGDRHQRASRKVGFWGNGWKIHRDSWIPVPSIHR